MDRSWTDDDIKKWGEHATEIVAFLKGFWKQSKSDDDQWDCVSKMCCDGATVCVKFYSLGDY
jgi:hypothetical protein